MKESTKNRYESIIKDVEALKNDIMLTTIEVYILIGKKYNRTWKTIRKIYSKRKSLL